MRGHQDIAYGYAYALLGDAHLAEDAAQEAFTVAWRRLDDLKTAEAFTGWLRRVVFTQCDRITRRARMRTVPLEEAAHVELARPGPDVRVEAQETRARVSRAIHALPEAERVATTLHYLDGYTRNEIAGFLGITSAAVGVRLHSARKRLKGRLEQMARDDVRESRPSRDDTFLNDVSEYLRQFGAQPEHADRSLLDTAWERLDRLVGRDHWTPDEARAALDVCVHYGRQDRGNEILERYLAQGLPVDEEAWARRHLTSGYAVCRESTRAVEEDRRLIAWARASLPPRRWAWAFSAGSAANCWVIQGQAQEWIDIYSEIIEATPATPETLDDRWILLRTAGRVFCELQQTVGVDDVVRRMEAVAAECDTEEAALKIRAEAAVIEMHLHEQTGSRSGLRDAARAILAQLNAFGCEPATADHPTLDLFAGLYHNVGGPLFRAQEYDLAGRCFRKSMEYGGGNAHTYGWLAACTHATGGDRRETLSLLREAAWRDYKGGNLWSRYRRKLPEFADVADDPEFARAGSVGQ